ncbi:Hypothetical protein ZAZAV_2 [Cedratvirus Zaza IHUMI]|uniref:Uncharacterized protein n=1 Tax=Cedratvirus Zaza IHUMI TaxID=2126979 RepID=A0A2R8FCZ2_9VIRU|nr:Hypothetical protein ZAZAV_2 [Cedratvirus Zaza IHUMI]
MQRVQKKTAQPTTRARREKRVLTAEEFTDLVKKINKDSTNLNKLASVVYALPKGKRIVIPSGDAFAQFPEGIQIGRTELKSLQSQHSSEIASLAGYFKSGLTAKKKSGKTIKHKVFIGPELLSFFRNGDFGPAYRDDGDEFVSTDSPIIDELPLLRDQGFAYTSTLTNLFYIYSDVHRLTRSNRYRADEFMTETLGEIFNRIIEERQTNQRLNKKGEVITFDPEDFDLTGFNSIIKYGRFIRPDEKNPVEGAQVLTPEQLAMYNDPELVPELVAEGAVTDVTKAARNTARALRREAEAAAAQ